MAEAGQAEAQQSESAAPGGLTAKSVDRAGQVLDGLLRDAKAAIQRSPHLKKLGNPLYGVPWYLFVGDEKAAVGTLLRAAAADSPFPPPDRSSGGEPAWWYWWFFQNAIAIEASPSLICESKDKAAWAIVERAMSLLGRYRPKLPLNGMVTVVSADSLLDRADQMKEYGRKLRALVDEAYKTMSLRFPIYVVVSHCQAVAGHDAFFGPLPDGVAAQVVGHRLDTAKITAKITQHLDGIFNDIRDRLHTIRLSLLRDSGETSDRRGIFDFVEQFTALKIGLSTLCDALFAENPFQYQPMWRGLYFTSAGAPSAHVADLFSRFLPTDASLAKRG